MATVSNLEFNMSSIAGQVYATWEFSYSTTISEKGVAKTVHTDTTTEGYSIQWRYKSADGVWFVNNTSVSGWNNKSYAFSIPEGATALDIKVMPNPGSYEHYIAKTVNGKKKYESAGSKQYYTSSWSGTKTITLVPPPPAPPTPGTPTIVREYTTDDNYGWPLVDVEASIVDTSTPTPYIVFQIYSAPTTFSSSEIAIPDAFGVARATLKVPTGGKGAYAYVIAYGWNGGTQNVDSMFSASSDRSSNITCPPLPTQIMNLYPSGNDSTAMKVELDSIIADTYEVKYSNDLDEFLYGNPQTVSSNSKPLFINGLTPGFKYYATSRAGNDGKYSSWHPNIRTFILGLKPEPPTNWSDPTKADSSQEILLCWRHNSKDSSYQTMYHLQYKFGSDYDWVDVYNYDYRTDEEKEEEATYIYHLGKYSRDADITWRVRTKGVLGSDKGLSDEEGYSDWSAERNVKVVEKPTIVATLCKEYLVPVPDYDPATRTYDVSNYSYMLGVDMTMRPYTQTATGFEIVMTNERGYQGLDANGDQKYIPRDSEIMRVYRKGVDGLNNRMFIPIGADEYEMSFSNNQVYKLTIRAYSNEGMYGETDFYMNVHYPEESNISFDAETLLADNPRTMYIRPMIIDQNTGELSNDDWLIDLLRREVDGRYVTVQKNIRNNWRTVVTDPHVALDYGRYRIIARRDDVGQAMVYDLPIIPINDKFIAIQWDERVNNYSSSDEGILPPEESTWQGNYLKLPYNIKMSNSYEQDKNQIKYIGREHPVSYHGTQLGEKATWNTEIDKKDVETLNLIRKLAIYNDSVYVREPTGTGYMADIEVSFNIEYSELTIPITINVTRVEE